MARCVILVVGVVGVVARSQANTSALMQEISATLTRTYVVLITYTSTEDAHVRKTHNKFHEHNELLDSEHNI